MDLDKVVCRRRRVPLNLDVRHIKCEVAVDINRCASLKRELAAMLEPQIVPGDSAVSSFTVPRRNGRRRLAPDSRWDGRVGRFRC
jgi:hypothetical protein